jgi:hypothetical protein
MGMSEVPRCQHVKVNGTQCGSPALRRKRFCYFHDSYRHTQARVMAEQSKVSMANFPPLEDANSVQVAVMHVIHLLGSGKLDAKTAGLMLFGLQTASTNIKRVSFEVENVTDVVIDQDTLDLTCIHGPQWFERDFEEQSTEKNEAALAANREDLRAKSTNARKKPDPLRDAPENAFTKILERFVLATENAENAIKREPPSQVPEADSLRN